MSCSDDTLTEFEGRLGVSFRNRSLLERALRHRSAAPESPDSNNERMEFLGDSILGLVVCDYLFSRFPGDAEGRLALRKAHLVSEPVLTDAARSLGVSAVLEMSAPERLAGGAERPSALSDALEALAAAVYLDQGLRAARSAVRRWLTPAFATVDDEGFRRDYKTILQERTQAASRRTPSYALVHETGADHEKTFLVEVSINGKVSGRGQGRSKKQAEQAAARAALSVADTAIAEGAPE